jgi:hypothetical protein
MSLHTPADDFWQAESFLAGSKDDAIEAVDGVGFLEYLVRSIASGN